MEYGKGLRAPDEIRRPTFPELYDRAKLMRGRTSHAWLDNGTLLEKGWVYANHSVMTFLKWIDLKDIDNNSIKNEIRNLHKKENA